MIEALKSEALKHGGRLQVIPIKHLQTLKEEIESFRETEGLNGFHEFIFQNMYCFDLPKVDFDIKSIILVAIAHPMYAELEFEKSGKIYKAIGNVTPDFEGTYKYINNFLEAKDFHIKAVHSIPMKRLATRCGLAKYGKNNICYVDDLGSCISFAAFYSDLTCDNYMWIDMKHADECENCGACLKNCPTGAIRSDRFLLANDKCLAFFNEGQDEFPEWIPKSAHHSIYDCLKCQTICPMNKAHVSDIVGPLRFNEKETKMLLEARNIDEYSEEFLEKARILGINEWPDIIKAIPRNLKVIFEQSDNC